ncbi:hypothetical protein BDR22DRAFT_865119 [Usnea florida]
MHISPLLLLALGTVALTLPTSNNTTTNTSLPLLSKRASYPWIDWFEDDDGTCASREGGDSDDAEFTEMRAGSCVPFSSATSRVGGSWGADFYSITSFWAFENEDCTGTVKQKVQRKGSEAGFCFTSDCLNGYDEANPCYFQSVRGNW